eukprot:TRINITY_DN8920_c0_g1_i1.p1 TRINITY_DN8920_c0_g1~~TRINITY_DN8920_c0_g1_i1.p1  ORF type:complete len:204 (-),score=57.55 TRINITY_DN8920_c0_g1_i1:53-664(-)
MDPSTAQRMTNGPSEAAVTIMQRTYSVSMSAPPAVRTIEQTNNWQEKKGVIANILTKFFGSRPTDEDLIQKRILPSTYPLMPLRLSIIEELCEWLEKNSLKTEGLFRVSGTGTVIRDIWCTFDKEHSTLPEAPYSEHNVSSALKLYLREQPNPLIPYELYSATLSAQRKTGQDQIDGIKQIISQLPALNYEILQRILSLLLKV